MKLQVRHLIQDTERLVALMAALWIAHQVYVFALHCIRVAGGG